MVDQDHIVRRLALVEPCDDLVDRLTDIDCNIALELVLRQRTLNRDRVEQILVSYQDPGHLLGGLWPEKRIAILTFAIDVDKAFDFFFDRTNWCLLLELLLEVIAKRPADVFS